MAGKPRRSTSKARTRASKVVREVSERPEKQRRRGRNETCLQMHCRQWLEKSGIWDRHLIFHVPNERKGGIGAIMHFKRMGVRPGIADWLMFTNRNAAIEIKDDKGRQRKGQEQFQRDWEGLGHLYFVVRTLEEFQGIVTALILF
jgi:hypothetical protein